MTTQAQLNANLLNAQLSTGPKTAEGKAKSSLNAVKTGLTGRTVLLPSDDVTAYQAHLARFAATWQPSGDTERSLVQSLADTDWRLLRIPALEAGLFALGRREFAAQFETEDPSIQDALIDAQTLRAYRRDFSNLGTQESRLRRQQEKDTAALAQLQEARNRRQAMELAEAAKAYEAAKQQGTPFDPAAFGFEFSIEQIEARVAQLQRLRERNAAGNAQAKAAVDAIKASVPRPALLLRNAS